MGQLIKYSNSLYWINNNKKKCVQKYEMYGRDEAFFVSEFEFEDEILECISHEYFLLKNGDLVYLPEGVPKIQILFTFSKNDSSFVLSSSKIMYYINKGLNRIYSFDIKANERKELTHQEDIHIIMKRIFEVSGTFFTCTKEGSFYSLFPCEFVTRLESDYFTYDSKNGLQYARNRDPFVYENGIYFSVSQESMDRSFCVEPVLISTVLEDKESEINEKKKKMKQKTGSLFAKEFTFTNVDVQSITGHDNHMEIFQDSLIISENEMEKISISESEIFYNSVRIVGSDFYLPDDTKLHINSNIYSVESGMLVIKKNI